MLILVMTGCLCFFFFFKKVGEGFNLFFQICTGHCMALGGRKILLFYKVFLVVF